MSVHGDNRKKRFKARCKDLLVRRRSCSLKYINSRKSSELSTGEMLVAEVLYKNNIRFIREYYCNGLYSWKTQTLLFFDFYLPNYNAVIEFDGPHHFKHQNPEKFARIKYNDRRKNEYCKRNCMPILRIPYYNSGMIEHLICKWFDETISL